MFDGSFVHRPIFAPSQWFLRACDEGDLNEAWIMRPTPDFGRRVMPIFVGHDNRSPQSWLWLQPVAHNPLVDRRRNGGTISTVGLFACRIEGVKNANVDLPVIEQLFTQKIEIARRQTPI